MTEEVPEPIGRYFMGLVLEQRPPGDLRLSALRMSQTSSLTGRARMSNHGDLVVRTKRSRSFLCCVAGHHAYDSHTCHSMFRPPT